MKPYFAAESPAFDVGISVVDTSGPTTLSTFTLSIPADRYAISEVCNGSGFGNARNLFRLLCDEVTSNTTDLTLGLVPFAADDLTGIGSTFSATGANASGDLEIQFTGTNAALGRSVFGFTGDIAFTDLGVGSIFRYRADLDKQPLGTWFPKSHIVDRDDWVPHPRDMFHSQITGDGSSTGVEHGDGVQRYWRRWLISAVPGARISNRRASNTVRDWYETAGLASASGAERVALDHYTSATDYGWWYATQDGKTRFICVEDESATTPEFSRYRINLADTRAPMSMQSWLSLTDPNISKYSDGAGRRDVAFCAIEVPI